MQRIIRHTLVDSTNERAFVSLAAGKARDGDLHLASGQSAGRGRLQRPWESAEGEGLYLSYVHLPAGPGPLSTAMTMGAGLALLGGLLDLGLGGARLDWPNDLVVAGSKLAGILIESRGFDPSQPHYVVGIGVNVRQRAFSEELRAERKVTSLALEGLDCVPDELGEALQPLLGARFAQAKADPAGLARDYLAATGLAGEAVEVRVSGPSSFGILREIDLERGLLLETDEKPLRIRLAHIHGVDRSSL